MVAALVPAFGDARTAAAPTVAAAAAHAAEAPADYPVIDLALDAAVAACPALIAVLASVAPAFDAVAPVAEGTVVGPAAVGRQAAAWQDLSILPWQGAVDVTVGRAAAASVAAESAAAASAAADIAASEPDGSARTSLEGTPAD